MITKNEANYFAGIKVQMIQSYLANNPDHARRNIGIIEGGDSIYVWQSEDFLENPKCECGWRMNHGTFIFTKNGINEFHPYWWCENEKCSGERRARWTKEIADYRECQGQEPSAFAESLNKMGIPVTFHAMTFGNFDNDKSKTLARKAFKNNESIFFTGKTGTGKTHLSVGLLIENGHTEPNYYRFINVPKLIMELHSDVKADRDYTERIQNLTNIKVLCLDDMGAEKTTEYVRAVLYEIINERLMSGKQTIVTSNMSLDEIGANIDDRLASRLSSYHIIELTGADRRRMRKERHEQH